MNNVNFEQLMDIAQLAIVVVALFLVYRSYPAKEIDNLLRQLSPQVEKTDTKIDDILLEVAEMLHGMRRDTEPSNTGEKPPL